MSRDNSGGSATLGSCELEDEAEREEKTKTALGDDKLELERCRGAMADAWRRSPAARRRYGVGRHFAEHSEPLFTRLNDFDSVLTS